MKSGVLLIGEGPGENEDATGVPFVGRAGKLLDAILGACGFLREDIYITNIVKCRPPGNRDPRPEEVNACRPWLDRQIQLLEPKLIVAIGRPAAVSLLRSNRNLKDLRNKTHSLNQVPLIVTYHPAYLLRSPGMKKAAWEDWKNVIRTASISEAADVEITGSTIS